MERGIIRRGLVILLKGHKAGGGLLIVRESKFNSYYGNQSRSKLLQLVVEII